MPGEWLAAEDMVTYSWVTTKDRVECTLQMVSECGCKDVVGVGPLSGEVLTPLELDAVMKTALATTVERIGELFRDHLETPEEAARAGVKWLERHFHHMVVGWDQVLRQAIRVSDGGMVS